MEFIDSRHSSQIAKDDLCDHSNQQNSLRAQPKPDKIHKHTRTYGSMVFHLLTWVLVDHLPFHQQECNDSAHEQSENMETLR